MVTLKKLLSVIRKKPVVDGFTYVQKGNKHLETAIRSFSRAHDMFAADWKSAELNIKKCTISMQAFVDAATAKVSKLEVEKKKSVDRMGLVSRRMKEIGA